MAKPAWAWCFPRPAPGIFLIDHHRSRDVIVRVLGASFAGTLVSDFYAAYNGLACAQAALPGPLAPANLPN